MKADERHRLKSNELAGWLGRVPDLARRYGKWVIGGLVVIVLIVGVMLFLNYRAQISRGEAWNELAKASTVEEASARSDKFAEVAQAYPDMPPITAWAMYMQADAIDQQSRRFGMRSGEGRDRAVEAYERVIKDRPYHPVVTPLARLGLAEVALGGSEPDFERARELLIQVQTDQNADGAMKLIAESRVEQLAKAETVTFAVAPPASTRPDNIPDSLLRTLVPEFGPAPLGPIPAPAPGRNSGEPDGNR